MVCLCRVDFFIPGVEKVGGFSMCSSPGLLQREGIVELAVKYSKHPPAHWIHTTVRRPITYIIFHKAKYDIEGLERLLQRSRNILEKIRFPHPTWLSKGLGDYIPSMRHGETA